jgi:hypothetical protein
MIFAEPYAIPFNGNRFCGPAALAYVTRSDPDSAARLLREVSGKRAIMGTQDRYMVAAMTKAGLLAAPTMPDRFFWGKRLTLRRWVEIMDPQPNDEYVIRVTGHYLVVHGKQYFDSMCHLGKPVTRCPHRNRTVKAAWRIGNAAKLEAATRCPISNEHHPVSTED